MFNGFETFLVNLLLRLPNEILHFYPGTETLYGKTLHPKVSLCMKLASLRPSLDNYPPIQARDIYLEGVHIFESESYPVARLEEFWVSTSGTSKIKVRVYIPEHEPEAILPSLLYFHGGGFVVGDLSSVHSPLTYLCNQLKSIVVSVDYRLGPENRFPKAFDDAINSYEWMLKNIKYLGGDVKKIGVGGDSAGASLATYISMQTFKSQLQRPAYQLLFYPYLDPSKEYPSYKQFDRFLLTPEILRYFKSNFFRNPSDESNPEFFHFHAKENYNMPPTIIQLAGFDPLYDEGLLYSQKLEAEGVKVKLQDHSGYIHGYLHLIGVIPDIRKSLDESINHIKEIIVS